MADITTESVSVKMDESGPPPAYSHQSPGTQDNIPPAYNNEPPPSYESVFGRVRQMREESNGNAEFTKKLVGCVLCGTICSIVMVVVMLAIPTSCLVFGAIYLGECPREKYIPIYLVVAGVFGLVKALLGIVQMVIKAKAKRAGQEEDPGSLKIVRFVDSPISCFLSCWFISGSVWVYRIHHEFSEDPTAIDYCNPTLYMFAFWIITAQYILIALCVLCCCIGIIIACCLGAKAAAEEG